MWGPLPSLGRPHSQLPKGSFQWTIWGSRLGLPLLRLKVEEVPGGLVLVSTSPTSCFYPHLPSSDAHKCIMFCVLGFGGFPANSLNLRRFLSYETVTAQLSEGTGGPQEDLFEVIQRKV